MLGWRSSSACLVCWNKLVSLFPRLKTCWETHSIRGNRLNTPTISMDPSNPWSAAAWSLLTGQGLGDLFVDNDVDLDAPFGSGAEHVIQTVLLIAGRRPSEVELGAQPPVEDVDALPSLC